MITCRPLPQIDGATFKAQSSRSWRLIGFDPANHKDRINSMGTISIEISNDTRYYILRHINILWTFYALIFKSVCSCMFSLNRIFRTRTLSMVLGHQRIWSTEPCSLHQQAFVNVRRLLKVTPGTEGRLEISRPWWIWYVPKNLHLQAMNRWFHFLTILTKWYHFT